MILKRRDVTRALTRKFSFSPPRNTHHRYYELWIAGRLIAVTHVSHGSKGNDIGEDLQQAMGQQMRLTKAQFCEAVECTLSRLDYYKILALRDPELSKEILDSV